MKKLTLLTLLITVSFFARAQFPPTETFNSICATSSFPLGWISYSPPALSMPPAGKWGCTSNKGRPTTSGAPTAGMTCTGTFSTSYHLDTAFLISPILNLHSSDYPSGHAYVNFDTKTDNIILGGKIAMGSPADTMVSSYYDFDTAGLLTPVFGIGDSTNWVTHQADLTQYLDQGPFYVAFRYTSTSTTGTSWYVDNIYMSPFKLGVPRVDKEQLPMSVLGNSTPTRIELSFSIVRAGSFDIEIYDMVGRKVYDEKIVAREGTADHTITGLNLRPGMYCIKMGNEDTYGTTKLLIQ